MIEVPKMFEELINKMEQHRSAIDRCISAAKASDKKIDVAFTKSALPDAFRQMLEAVLQPLILISTRMFDEQIKDCLAAAVQLEKSVENL